MIGNLWQLCADWYGATSYDQSPVADPRGPSTGILRVQRGCGWLAYGMDCRSAVRAKDAPGNFVSFVGFRVVVDTR